MKKAYMGILSLFVSFVLVVPAQVGAESTINFKDVSRFKEEITFLAENEIVQGFTKDKFAPDATLTRAQAVLMIARTFDTTSFVPDENPFADVHAGMKAYEAILFAYEYDIIGGFEDGTFRPDETLTRGQMAQIMVKAYGLKGSNGKLFSDATNSRFKDAISTVAAHRITEGYEDGTFRPNKGMKRMEFAAFLARELEPLFKPAYKLQEKTAKELSAWADRTVEVMVYANGEGTKSATGFITESGLIATTYNTVAGGDEVVVHTADRNKHPMEGVVYIDMNNDVVLLKPEYPLPYPGIPMVSSDHIEIGETIYSFGLPIGFPDFEQNEGHVLEFLEGEFEGETYHLFQISSRLTPGNTGGPIINKYGQAIGLNSFSLGVEGFNSEIYSPVLETLIPVLDELLYYYWDEIPVEDLSSLPIPEVEEDTAIEESIN